MNPTQSIFQALPSTDAVQSSTSASSNSQSNRSNNQDFADALNDADQPKPPRRNSASKPHADSSGGQLPPSGNQPPPALGPPPPASTESAAASGDSSNGGNASTAAIGTALASASGAGATGAQPGVPGDVVANAQGTEDPDAPALTAAQAAIIAAEAAADTAGVGAQATGAGPSMPHATAMAPPVETGPPPAAVPISTDTKSSATARVPGASTAARVAKPDGMAGKAVIAAATSASTTSDDSVTSTDTTLAGTATDPTAQAIMAAATGQATSAPAIEPGSPSDDVAGPDTGVAAQGVQGPNASPAAAVASTAMHAAATTAAAVTAATAASIAQAVSASADSGATDKHGRGNDANSSIAGASNDGTAGAAQLLSAASSTSSTDTPMPTFKVAAGVDTGEFGQGVADRVSLMMDGNLTSAKLQVNPPALGPIEVRIALQSGHAQVWFTSHSAVTRDALESSAPKLREMLGNQGFGQVSVDISQRSFQDRPPPQKGYAASQAIGSVSASAVESTAVRSRIASGILDAYA